MQDRIFLSGALRPARRQLPETAKGTHAGDLAFFCNFLLTNVAPQFIMAVGKIGERKEVGEKLIITSS
jgi:hypothetical protein